MDNLNEKLENVTATLNRINSLKNKSKILFDKIKEERQQIITLKNSSVDIEKQLKINQNTIQDVKNVCFNN